MTKMDSKKEDTPSLVVPNVIICMPGGSGKTTFCRKHCNSHVFFDIDDVWDAKAAEESKMTRQWQDAMEQNNDSNRRRLEQECVLFKATKFRKLMLEKQLLGIPNGGVVLLCQSMEQARIILGGTCCSRDGITSTQPRVVCMVPSEDLHRRNLQDRGDDERTKSICWEQRIKLLQENPSCHIYKDFEELERILTGFVQEI